MHWSQNHKKDWWFDCLFALLGSGHAKAARKTLMELTPDLASYASYAYFCKCPYHSSLVSRRNSSEQKMHLNGIVSGETFWGSRWPFIPKSFSAKTWKCKDFIECIGNLYKLDFGLAVEYSAHIWEVVGLIPIQC